MNATPTKVETKAYKVAAVSKNQQSFGHTGHILIAQDGQCVHGLRINGPWQSPTELKTGTILEFEIGKDGRPNKPFQHGFELFEEPPQGQPPREVVELVWHADFPNNRG